VGGGRNVRGGDITQKWNSHGAGNYANHVGNGTAGVTVWKRAQLKAHGEKVTEVSSGEIIIMSTCFDHPFYLFCLL